MVTFALLAIAYGLYGRDQERTLGEAFVDLGREQLASVLPVAILTQWVLLCGFWVLFGLLMRVPVRQLAAPLWAAAGVGMIALQLVVLTVAVMSLISGDYLIGLAALGGLVLVNYLYLVSGYTPEPRPEQRGFVLSRMARPHGDRPPSCWRRSAGCWSPCSSRSWSGS